MARISVTRHLFVARVSVVLLLITLSVEAKKDPRDCEVCLGFLDKLTKTISDDDRKNVPVIEKTIRKLCNGLPKSGKENRFCYYIGGTDDAATGILSLVSKPFSYYKPIESICKDLKNKDSQICDLRYDAKPDFSKLAKMRVGELKKILSSWNEDNACKGCAEKSDYVKKVKELMEKYEPEEFKKLQEKIEL